VSSALWVLTSLLLRFGGMVSSTTMAGVPQRGAGILTS
jgi:hypothetical protein